MAWYTAEFSCGHTEDVQLYGPGKERERQLYIMKTYKICSACEEADRKETIAAAAAAGLPALSGTEKQAAWAVSIRSSFIDQANKDYENGYVSQTFGRVAIEDREKFKKMIEWACQTKTSSRYWIDNRVRGPLTMYEKLMSEYEDVLAKAVADSMPEAVDAKAEATVYPEGYNGKPAVELIPDKGIDLISEKDSEIIAIAKRFGFKWNGKVWNKHIGKQTGSYPDSMAEIGNALLRAGYAVIIYKPEFRRRAIAGEFMPETDRWIIESGVTPGLIAIMWEEYNNSIYQAARRLPGVKYQQGAFMLNPKHYKAIEDFARQYDFRISKAAESLMSAEAERIIETTKIGDAKPVKEVEDALSADKVMDLLRDE